MGETLTHNSSLNYQPISDLFHFHAQLVLLLSSMLFQQLIQIVQAICTSNLQHLHSQSVTHLHYTLQLISRTYKPLMTYASTVWPLTSSRRCSSAGELGLLSALSQSSPSPPRRESSGRAAACYQRQPFRAQMQRNHGINRCGKVNYP